MSGGFAWTLVQAFAVALGVDLGGALLAAAAAALTGGYPLRTLGAWAEELRLWGAIAALGGSFDPLRGIEQGIFYLDLRVLAKQVLWVVAALSGAHTGYLLLRALAGEPR
ncbi:MAG: YtrH family sporulation protein [Bacillota bacterium]|nr:MAG: sporulation protein [Bacillota bacterium]